MAIDFVKTAAMIVIFGFLWNLLKARTALSGDEPGRLASAMAFIY